MRSRLTAASLAAIAALLAMSGCGGAQSGGSASVNGGAPSSRQADKSTGSEGGQVDQGPGQPVGVPAIGKRVTIQRARVLTAELTVRAKNPGDVGDVADRAIVLVQGSGGEVAGDSRNQAGSRTRADVILKVAPSKYADTLNKLAKLGTELRRSSQAQDVTDEVVDVNSRVSSQLASVDRVRKLFARANSLGDIVTIEAELGRRQADLESLQARQRALDGQTADATITLHVQAPGATAAPKQPADRGFLAGFSAGWKIFVASVTVLLTVLGATLPFAALVAIAYGLWLVARRRHAVAPAAPAGSE
ncbi:MAG: DUF4349 domain-containing protein [Mycobacteriales bacterium]